ncbi:MAG: hypothetical protein KAI24_01355 [Planctomycetes bacterium]|nr:hypothetical protein [Planctomycetota bacterium]
MGHIVIAAPGVDRFHLLERLQRDLLRRGHRVSLVCVERADFTFWHEQGFAVELLGPAPGDRADPNATTALEHVAPPGERRRIERLVPAAARWFERQRPDLTLLVEQRSAATAALQFAARSAGRRILWIGAGLLPHTLQVDERGLDGDAGSRRFGPADYRVVAPDDQLLEASLAHALAGGRPLALPRAEVRVPPVARRLLDASACALRGRVRAAAAALTGWQRALHDDGPPGGAATARLDLKPPFVAALLQSHLDPRVRHDGGRAPSPADLVRGALAAAERLGAGGTVVAVLPDPVAAHPRDARALAGSGCDRVRVVPASAAAVAAATAAAVVTINHPLATVGLLAGTPVVHTGLALYGLEGVTTSASVDALPDAVAAAVRRDRPSLRRRFLTWLLRHGHVWCSATAPNHNGVLGLVQAIEQRLTGDGARPGQPLPYRPGPTWPLQTS